jgi:predicted ArsR family transcriptional regulator
MDDARVAQVAAVAALAEPTRRRLYEHVVRSLDPVSRDEAATVVGLPRATAAFHLDRLVDDGLLDVVYQRRSGRTGPGAGRPAKLYRRGRSAVAVSLPDRHYDLAGDLLAAAMTEAEIREEPPRTALRRLATERGRALAAGAPCADADPRAAVLSVLEGAGYEPRDEDGAVGLANCPFHALARDHTELVCGMNLHMLEGVLDVLPDAALTARLQPGPGGCCVRLEPVRGRDGDG